jgi:aminoglycoside phosphotransferase (APT) family kinase protein
MPKTSIVAEQTRRSKAQFERIDESRLKDFIEAQNEVRGPVTLLSTRYLTEGAGVTNGIAFVRMELDQGEGRSEKEFVLRYSPGPTLFKQKSFADEFLTLRVVSARGLPVPHVYWLDADGSQVGRPAFLMERVKGEAPSAALFSEGPIAKASPAERKAMMLKAARFHGRLRKTAIGGRDAPHLIKRGTGSTAIERELSWWLKEAQLADDPDSPRRRLLLEKAANWLVNHQPKLYEPILVHGDSQIANVMFDRGEIAAVLDWELSYLGHVETDFAFLCWQTRALQEMDKRVDGIPTDEEYMSAFESESGSPLQAIEFFQVFILVKIMCVYVCLGPIVPSFDQVWKYHEDALMAAWAKAENIYI